MDLGEGLHVLSYLEYLLEVVRVVSIQLLEIIGSLRNLEIGQGQIAHHELLVSDEVVQLLQLDLDLVVVQLPFLLVVDRGVEHVYRRVEDVLQHEQHHLDLGLVLDG